MEAASKSSVVESPKFSFNKTLQQTAGGSGFFNQPHQNSLFFGGSSKTNQTSAVSFGQQQAPKSGFSFNRTFQNVAQPTQSAGFFGRQSNQPQLEEIEMDSVATTKPAPPQNSFFQTHQPHSAPLSSTPQPGHQYNLRSLSHFQTPIIPQTSVMQVPPNTQVTHQQAIESKPKESAKQSNIYSLMSKLNKEEIEQFQSAEFTFIPLHAPPIELCR